MSFIWMKTKTRYYFKKNPKYLDKFGQYPKCHNVIQKDTNEDFNFRAFQTAKYFLVREDCFSKNFSFEINLNFGIW